MAGGAQQRGPGYRFRGSDGCLVFHFVPFTSLLLPSPFVKQEVWFISEVPSGNTDVFHVDHC